MAVGLGFGAGLLVMWLVFRHRRSAVPPAMFTFLVSHSLRNRALVLAIALVLLGYGGFIATRLPVDVFPDLNRPTVTLMTEAEGLAPPEVELDRCIVWAVARRYTPNGPGASAGSAVIPPMTSCALAPAGSFTGAIM